MKASPIAVVLPLLCLAVPACNPHEKEGEHHEEHQQIVATCPLTKDVVVTQQYVCQIRSQKHVEIKAMDEGFLEQVPVKEGQHVQQGQVMFRVVPTLYKARLDTELAEVKLAELELKYTKVLADPNQRVVSPAEVAVQEAKLYRAQKKADQAQTELDFATVKAPFDGIMDRINQQQGSLVKKEEILTTLSDNSVMWVTFNVPEARWVDYQETQALQKDGEHIELVLANGSKFPHPGRIGAVGSKFNNETGNIPLRADFPNPQRLLRHGQTGNILIHHPVKDALVIPQRAVYEILNKQYVYVLDEHDVAHQRLIAVDYEQEDVFVIKSGLTVKDRIILEGVRQGLDGKHVQTEYRKPEDALKNLKQHAE